MIDITIVFIIASVCILAGLLFGYLIGSMGKRTGREPEPRSKEWARPAHGEDQERQGLVEVVRFWSDEEGKKVVPEVGGRMIHSLKELDDTQRTRLARLMDFLRTGSPAVTSPEVAATPPPTQQVEVQKPPPKKSVTRPVFDVSQAVVESTPPPASFSLLSALGRALQPDTSKVPVTQKSIAAQIDEILQEMLAGTHLAHKGVRLMELPDKGMVVLVGLEQYPGVDEVPDPQVRQAIRDAVAAWENQVAPD